MNRKLSGVLVISGVVLVVILLKGVFAKPMQHDFEGKCQLCHGEIPAAGARFEDLEFRDDPDKLCAHCHTLQDRTSHPVGVKPRTAVPLQMYLDKAGQLTCLTCHDVHKERREAMSRQESKGLLRGHAQGRAFCFVCHKDDVLGANWRHNLVVTYAHSPGRLVQSEIGKSLDEYSVECLSCHDGIISRITPGVVVSGSFEHGIGLSHPVGVEYPVAGSDNAFVPRDMLPQEVKLFNGTVGCLSCHNPYDHRNKNLVMSNVRSALCLTCHRK